MVLRMLLPPDFDVEPEVEGLRTDTIPWKEEHIQDPR